MIRYAITLILFTSCSLVAQERSIQYIGPDNLDVRDFCITPGNQFVYTAAGNTIDLYEILSGQKIHSVSFDAGEEIRSIALSSDSTFLVAGTDKGSIEILMLVDNSRQSIQCSKHPVTSVAINGFNSRIASGTADGEIIISDMHGRISERLKAHEDIITDIEFSNDGALLLSSGMDGGILVTDLQGAPESYFLSRKNTPCRSIAINSDMSGFLASYDEGAVYKWFITSNNTFIDEGKTSQGGWSTGVDYHRDGRTWVSCSSSGKIEINSTFDIKYSFRLKGVATRVKFCYLQDPRLLVLFSVYKGGLVLLSVDNMKMN